MNSISDYEKLVVKLRDKFCKIIRSDVNSRIDWILYAKALSYQYRNDFSVKNKILVNNSYIIFDYKCNHGRNQPTSEFDIFSNLDYTDPILIQYINNLLIK